MSVQCLMVDAGNGDTDAWKVELLVKCSTTTIVV